jgi:hypothetical protein
MQPTPPASTGGGVALLLGLVVLVGSASPGAANIFGCPTTEQPKTTSCCQQVDVFIAACDAGQTHLREQLAKDLKDKTYSRGELAEKAMAACATDVGKPVCMRVAGVLAQAVTAQAAKNGNVTLTEAASRPPAKQLVVAVEEQELSQIVSVLSQGVDGIMGNGLPIHDGLLQFMVELHAQMGAFDSDEKAWWDSAPTSSRVKLCSQACADTVREMCTACIFEQTGEAKAARVTRLVGSVPNFCPVPPGETRALNAHANAEYHASCGFRSQAELADDEGKACEHQYSIQADYDRAKVEYDKLRTDDPQNYPACPKTSGGDLPTLATSLTVLVAAMPALI